MSRDIEKKVNSIIQEAETKSFTTQQLKEYSFNSLLAFLNISIEKASAQSKIHSKVDELLLAKMEAEGEGISYGVLLKLKELLHKHQTDSATPLLKILEQSNKQADQPQKQDILDSQREDLVKDGLSAKDIAEAKEILKDFRELKQSEFPEKKGK